MVGARIFSTVRLAGAAYALTLLLATPVVAAAEPEVGTAVLIKNKVTGKVGTDERELKTGIRVHRNEFLQTGPGAQAELKLDDNTKLALGPDAELRLDEYAVDTFGGESKAVDEYFTKRFGRRPAIRKFTWHSNPSGYIIVDW